MNSPPPLRGASLNAATGNCASWDGAYVLSDFLARRSSRIDVHWARSFKEGSGAMTLELRPETVDAWPHWRTREGWLWKCTSTRSSAGNRQKTCQVLHNMRIIGIRKKSGQPAA